VSERRLISETVFRCVDRDGGDHLAGFLSQLELPVWDAVLGNVGTTISFRLGLADAEIMEKDFTRSFRPPTS